MADWGEVNRIRERMTLNDRAELVKTFHIMATTKGGTPFSFNVAEEEIDAETVSRIAGEKAAILDRTLAL